MISLKNIHFEKLRSIAAEKSNPIVFWCGAGLSKGADLPLWTELKMNIINDHLNYANEEETIELNRIKTQKDLWVSFSMLKKLLQNATYQAYIRKYIETKSPHPLIYSLLWKMQPRGIITLNLDRYPALAYSSNRPGEKVNEFSGINIQEYSRLLRTPDSFIVNMHGIIENTNSWIFTREDLKNLQEKPGYYEFLTALFHAFTVVFIGISADDLAAGGTLQHLVFEQKIDLGTHYWITDRVDENANKWASKSNIGLIRYANGKHNEISEYLNEIIKFIPNDEEVNPITLEDIEPKEINPDNLNQKSANELRYILNAGIKKILKESNDSYSEYFNFTDKYDEECHRAWYIGKSQDKRILFDFSIIDEIGSGGFGTVYKVKNKNGEIYAMKVLHEKIRNEKDKMMCFRRGVKSLAILKRHNISNIVKLKAATEIPLLIVMEYINGMNLKEYKEAKYCEDWYSILEIIVKVSNILLSAHSLPERVLHRDLRPTNIMIRNNGSCEQLDIVVCDFDFSWHKDAIENSINRSPNGYLAPEQADKTYKSSTRSAQVDSFALGMNILYLVTGKHPEFKMHLQKDWQKYVKEGCKSIRINEWSSIPRRIERAIIQLTQDQQNSRWDITQINMEAKRLIECIENRKTPYAELIAEELMTRIIGQDEYRCVKNGYVFEYKNGLNIGLYYDEITMKCIFEIKYVTDGKQTFSNIRKYLAPKREHTKVQLAKLGWIISNEEYEKESFDIIFTIDAQKINNDIALFAKEMSNIKTDYNFN